MRRRDDVRVQSFIACFDVRSGERLWRTLIVSAETPGNGQWRETTHNLLTLSEGVLYFNTNMGAIAAVESSDGAVRWITSYPRAAFRPADLDRTDRHFLRDLNPCLVQDGLVVAAPGDCDRLFALDQSNGQLMWTAPAETAVDANNLLAAVNGRLIASGDSLYWFDLHRGRLLCQFPPPAKRADGHALPPERGFGRGVVAGGRIYFPTRQRILVFQVEPRSTPRGWSPQLAQAAIELRPRGVTGGNLLAARGVLFIAGPDRLYAFDAYGPPTLEE